jgi:hypothetical protein
MSRADPVVKLKAGRMIGEYKSKSEAAEENNYSVPGMMALLRYGNTSRDGSTYMLAKEWELASKGMTHVNAVPAQTAQAMPREIIQRMPDYGYIKATVTHGPVITGIEGGLANTPEMIEWLRDCREGLTERIPENETEVRFIRELTPSGAMIRITARLQLLKGSSVTGQRDSEYITEHGWQPATPWSNSIRYFAWKRERVFSLEGLG